MVQVAPGFEAIREQQTYESGQGRLVPTSTLIFLGCDHWPLSACSWPTSLAASSNVDVAHLLPDLHFGIGLPRLIVCGGCEDVRKYCVLSTIACGFRKGSNPQSQHGLACYNPLVFKLYHCCVMFLSVGPRWPHIFLIGMTDRSS